MVTKGEKKGKKKKMNDKVPFILGIKDLTQTKIDKNSKKITLEEDLYSQISRNHAKIYIDVDGPSFYFYI